MSEGGFCVGCGLAVERCRGDCGRSTGPERFCPECGRRLAEYVVVPGVTATRCRDHWRPQEDQEDLG